MAALWTHAGWETPLGRIEAAADERGLHFIRFAEGRAGAAAAGPAGEIGLSAAADSMAESGRAGSGAVIAAAEPGGAAILAALQAQLAAYFRGESAEFALPLHFAGHSAFRQAAWAAMRLVPAGQTRSYAEQAEMMGRPRSFCRAAAAANGANPFVIIVPCHRIIAAGGGLGGYSSGLARKRALLAHESRFWGAEARLI